MELNKERLYFVKATETEWHKKSNINSQVINTNGKSHYFNTIDGGFYMKESDLIKIMPEGCSSIERVQFVGYVYGVD